MVTKLPKNIVGIGIGIGNDKQLELNECMLAPTQLLTCHSPTVVRKIYKKNYLTGDESKESFVVFTEATETDVFTLKTIIYIKL